MLVEFNARVDAFNRQKEDNIRLVRMILEALTGTDGRKILPLPGDYDHLPEPTQANKYRLAKIWGKDKEWNVKPN